MKSRMVTIYRLTFSTLGLTAIVTEIIALNSRHIFNPINFFSYFTIESNLLAVVMMGVFAFTSKSKAASSKGLCLFKGAVTVYMLMTGVIFAILLAPIEGAILTAVPWDNIVLHYIAPLVVIADWLCLQSKITISFKRSLMWLGFPAVYVVYSLIRGSYTGWYPYPFLNANKNGYIQVFIVIGVLFIVVFFMTQVVRKMLGSVYLLKRNS